MKKLIIILLFVPLISLGQIGKVEENENKTVVIGVADKMVGYPRLSNLEGTDAYVIYYRNLEYRQLEDFKTFTFNATKEELDYLYNALLEPLVKKDKSKKSITVGDVTLNFQKKSSSITVFVDHPVGETDGWMGFLSKKQLARLFGKN